MPAVTRFTNMAIVDRRVQLAFAHRNIFKLLVEPYEYTGDPVPSLLAAGSGMSDYQIVHRARKSQVYAWAVLEANTRWHCAILSRLAAVLDSLTYEWFGGNGVEKTMHELIVPSGVIGKAQAGMVDLLDSWECGRLGGVVGGGRSHRC